MASSKGAKYYAVESRGLFEHFCGEPGMICKFDTKTERDEWVITGSLRRAIPTSHIWVKQANWLVKNDGDNPNNWTTVYILLVSYDMTEAA